MSPEVFRGYGTAGKEVGPEVLRNKMGFDLEHWGVYTTLVLRHYK